MHDAIAAEKVGVPSVGVMTSKFESAAELMARALGAEAYRFAVIDHPISSASELALAEQATAAIRRGIEIVTTSA
ncbi:MAG: hypothetical protein VW462_08910 [Rhodospirillales bacterium]